MSRPPKLSQSPIAKLFTVAEVAVLDNCSEKTVRRAIRAGLLEARYLGPSGNMIRIHPEALAAYRRGKQGY